MTDLLTAPLARPVPLVRPRVARRAVIDVDVVIVGYHSRDLVLACLDSLAAAADGAVLSVTVVDNGSNDGTVEAVAARGDGTRVIDMGENTGFAVANNAGMARGTGRYVLVLNPDTVVGHGALRTLVEFADRHRGAGVVAPRLLNADGTPQLTGRAFPTAAAGIFGRRSLLTRWFPNNRWSRKFLAERERRRRRPAVRGRLGVRRRDAGAAHGACGDGGFDEGFFLFWEDADWCRRIKDAGYSVWCVPGGHRRPRRGRHPRPSLECGGDPFLPPRRLPLLDQVPRAPVVEPAALGGGRLLSARAGVLILGTYFGRPARTGDDSRP